MCIGGGQGSRARHLRAVVRTVPAARPAAPRPRPGVTHAGPFFHCGPRGAPRSSATRRPPHLPPDPTSPAWRIRAIENGFARLPLDIFVQDATMKMLRCSKTLAACAATRVATSALPDTRPEGVLPCLLPLRSSPTSTESAVDAALGYSTIVLDSAEKLLDLNMKVARSVLADNAREPPGRLPRPRMSRSSRRSSNP